jgi:glycosyltransferase involved in cell wall biosynthesis
MKLSVVVCVRNEEARLRECLETVYANKPDEVILVDGDSSDNTVAIAREFPNINIIISRNSSLTRDRQKGLDAARNELVAMIDADHRLLPGDLASLLVDMKEFQFDIVQSCVISFCNQGFWDTAEEASWMITHNIPGRRKDMIGVAPAIFHKRVFNYARFDDHITGTIEDTDFSYRLSKFPEIRFGVGKTKIRQFHFADFKTYVKKFKWYGKGDGEFCSKHPERLISMLFHLLVRYPFIHSFKALRYGRLNAIPFFVLQGIMRFFGLVNYFLRIK